jgi:hypothetical protein
VKKHPSSFGLALIFSLAAAGSARPETAPANPLSELKPPASAVTNSTTAPRRPRVISPEVAASLAAAMPKYAPPKPVEKKAEEAPAPDLRETDKPKNEIPRLPTVVVRAQRDPIFRERDVNTPESLAAIARKRYLSEMDGGVLNRWNLFGTRSLLQSDATTGRALQMYADEERLKNMAQLSDDAGLVSARDKADGAYIKREALKINQRTDDFGWKNSNK